MPQGDDVDLTRTRGASDPPTRPSGQARTWGEFQLIAELGRGGFGRVYHAWDPTLARDIALKIVRLPDATEAATALREGRMLARVRHRNVVTVYGAQQVGDEVGVWMELIRGRPLSQVVREQGPLGAEEATVIGISLCQALAAVHGAGLLHRDIKTNNVMRESGGRIVLMDFGTGRDSESIALGDLAGTPAYMAPEVLDGGVASPESDLYSVGVLLYFIVTGEYPVTGRSMLELSLAHRRNQRRLLADRRPDLPDGFVRAVERALSPDPTQRPLSAGAMMRDLTAALPGSIAWEARAPDPGRFDPATPGGTPPASLLSTPSTVGAPSAARRWTGIAVAAVAVVGVLGLLTTAAFDQSLERDVTFSDDGPFDWWVFGARSLVYPALLAGVVIALGRLVVTAWQAILRLLPPLRRALRHVTGPLRGMAPHVGAHSPVTIAQWLVFFQVLAVVVLGIHFQSFIEAVTYPSIVRAEYLGLLGPESTTPLFYRTWLTLVLVGTAAGWYGLLARPGRRAAIHRTILVAGGAAATITLLMLVVPYRILYYNEMPRTQLGADRCYETGSRRGQVLLYCPDLPPPRVKIADDTTLTRSGSTVRESIFSLASPPP
jgi:hypothetical protein